MNRGFVLVVLLMLGLAAAAGAVTPEEMLPDPSLEVRARVIGKDLRCLVCQNQSIDDSDADLAKDLRIIVRERLQAGDSDEQVRRFLVERYGDYVLLKPPLKVSTYALWFGPLLLFALGVAAAFSFYRRSAAVQAPLPLSAEEERRIATLMEGKTK